MDDKIGELTSEYEDKIETLEERVKDLEESLEKAEEKANSNFLLKN